jgi:glutathione S-transferase
MMVVMTAAQSGIPLETELVDLFHDAQHGPAYLDINPNGMVPTLRDGDFVLWESNAIAQFLAAMKPGNTLWPNDERIRADIARWQFWALAHWMPACRPYVFENMFKELKGLGGPDATVLNKAQETFDRLAQVLNGHLKESNFLVGTNVTLADISTACWLMYAQPARIPLNDYPSIKRWFATIQAMASWQKSQPPAGLFKSQGSQNKKQADAVAA